MKDPKLQACGNTVVCGSVGGGTLIFDWQTRIFPAVHVYSRQTHFFTPRGVRRWFQLEMDEIDCLACSISPEFECVDAALCAAQAAGFTLFCWQWHVADIQTGRCGLDCREKNYQYFTAEIEHCTTATTAGKNTANVTGKGAFMWFHITACSNTSTTITTSAVSSAASSDPPPGQLGCIWSITLSLPMSSADISRRYCKPEDYLNFN